MQWAGTEQAPVDLVEELLTRKDAVMTNSSVAPTTTTVPTPPDNPFQETATRYVS